MDGDHPSAGQRELSLVPLQVPLGLVRLRVDDATPRVHQSGPVVAGVERELGGRGENSAVAGVRLVRTAVASDIYATLTGFEGLARFDAVIESQCKSGDREDGFRKETGLFFWMRREWMNILGFLDGSRGRCHGSGDDLEGGGESNHFDN